MMFTGKEAEYLLGNDFSNGYEFEVVRDTKLAMRVPFIVERVEGANVLHIGFTDHIPLIQKKIEKKQWLHGLLLESSEKCFGIDIHEEAVNYVRESLGMNGVFALDIVNDDLPQDILDVNWDYVILGEVLEHIDNPVEFLSGIRSKLKSVAIELIVTVPNAWDRTNLVRIKKGIEFINTDHRYWFTPFTLAKVMTRAGFEVKDIRMVQSYMPEGIWERRQIKKYPLMRETIVGIVNF